MRVVRIWAVGCLIACSAGCTTGRLRERTIRQGSTLPELQYQQVLDNLARFSASPGSLPWHVNLKEGTSQVTDSLSGGLALDLGPPVTYFPQLLGSRTGVAQWGMAPVVDPIELRLLRIAYRRAQGLPDMPSPRFEDELAHELKDQFASNPDIQNESALFYEYQARDHRTARELDAHVLSTNDATICAEPGPAVDRSPLAGNVCRKVESIRDELEAIRPGWFHVGDRRDVPRDARYTGRYGDRWAWVCADGVDDLTEFTLTVLKIATLIKETETLVNPGSVKFSPGDRGG